MFFGEMIVKLVGIVEVVDVEVVDVEIVEVVCAVMFSGGFCVKYIKQTIIMAEEIMAEEKSFLLLSFFILIL
jgi:hypothetical protein